MMTILAKGLSWVVGSNLVAPLSLIVALTMAHQAWLARDRRIEATGVQVCEAAHQLAAARAQRDSATVQITTIRALLVKEQQIKEELQGERDRIRQDFETHKAAASSDPRCLSDGVLDLLRGADGVGRAR